MSRRCRYSNIPDNVYFDANSGVGVVTVTSGAYSKSLDFSGYAGTFTGSIVMYCYGSLTLSPTMTWTHSSNIYFGGIADITSNGKTITSNIFTQYTGVVMTFMDDFTTTGSINCNVGTLNGNDKNITCGVFNSYTTSSRSLNMGSGLWTLNGHYLNIWNTSLATNLNFNKGTANIKIQRNPYSNYNFTGGGLIFNNLWDNSAGTDTLTLFSSNTFDNLKLSAGRIIKFSAGTTQTISSLTCIGTQGNLIKLRSSLQGSQYELSKSADTVICDYCDIKDSKATGGATWYAIHSIDNGNNTGWIFICDPKPDNPTNIQANPSEICNNGSSTLSATAANSYETVYWYNSFPPSGLPIATGPTLIVTPSLTKTYYTLAHNDIAGCESPCDSVTVIVNNILPVVVNITSANPVCESSPAIFTAQPINEGTTPTYQWQVNGINVGSNINTFTSDSLLNGDAVRCILTSSDDCTSGSPYTSNVITVNPLPLADAGVDQTICEGNSVNLTANGGTSYDWNNRITNGIPFTPSTTNTYTVTVTDVNGCSAVDSVTVIVKPLPDAMFTTSVNNLIVSLTATLDPAYKYFWNFGD